MDKNEIKNFIAQKVGEGLSLSKIQDLLNGMDCRMTFMELRLIASEIESGVWKKNDPVPAKPEEAPADSSNSDSPDDADGVPPMDGDDEDEMSEEPPKDAAGQGTPGKTVVELSRLVRPGAIASGSVKFGSGASADWFLDQTGRVGLEKPTGKPTQQDVQEFQMQLQKLLMGGGM